MQHQQTALVSTGQVNPAYDQPGPVRVVHMPYGHTLTRTSNVVTRYPHRQSLYLGATMIVAGALSIVFNIVDLSVGFGIDYASLGFVGHGFWSGVMCIIAGSFGISASRSRTAGIIRAFLVLSIIAASFCLAQMGVSIAGACIVGYGLDDCTQSYQYQGYRYSYYNDPSLCAQVRLKVAMEALLAILSLVGGAAAICGSALGCRVACCCSCCCCENYPATPANGICHNDPITVVTQQQQLQPQGLPQSFQYIYQAQQYDAGQPAYAIGSARYSPPYGYNQPAPGQ